MNPLIILGLLAGVPLLLALALRVSSVYLFASAAAGGLLAEHLSDDAALALNTAMKDVDPIIVMHLTLLLLPVALTMIFLRKTLKGSKFVLEVIPLIASIAMLVVLAVPQLPQNLQNDITATPYGKIIHNSEDVVVGAAALLNLGLMWLLNRKSSSAEHGGHHKKHH